MNRVCIIKEKEAGKAVVSALELLGGVDDLMRRYSHILIKPNLCGGVAGEDGSHTSMTVLAAVVEFFSYSGLPVSIGEADCSFNDAEDLFRSLGVRELGKRFGARVINLSEGPYTDRAVPNGVSLKTLRLSRVFDNALIVSVPVLKTHPWTGMTVTMKNMYGAVYDRQKSMLHAGLDQNIVDINKVIGPHLSIVDATTAVVRGGFKYGLWVGCPPSRLDLVVAGFNPVSVDAVGAKLLKCATPPQGHIRLADQQGLGTARLQELDITCNGCSFVP